MEELPQKRKDRKWKQAYISPWPPSPPEPEMKKEKRKEEHSYVRREDA